MKTLILPIITIAATFSFGSVSYACDMHGAGFGGFSLRNAPWQSYEPQASTTDPAFSEDRLITPETALSTKKRPSFSNAANMAALKAKAKIEKKRELEKALKKAEVKSTALDTDR